MNVLIVSPVSLYPNTTGYTNRIIEIAKSLSDSGVNVSVLHAGLSGRLTDDIRLYGYLSFESLFRSNIIPRVLDRYLCNLNFNIGLSLWRLCNKSKPDLIQYESPMGFISNIIAKSAIHNIPKVMDAHNVESLNSKRISALPFLYPYVLVMERHSVKRSDLILTTSNVDKKNIQRLYAIDDGKIVIIPNGVNVNKLSATTKNAARRELGIDESVKLVFFHGSMTWNPNVEAMHKITSVIAPFVRKSIPDAIFMIAGEGMKKSTNSSIFHNNGIRYLGFVSDLPKYIVASDVCIVPLLRGGGTSLKILEYMAAGKPIVTTMIGVRGLPIIDGKHAFIRNKLDSDFPEAIIEILESPEEDRIGNLARELALEYDWKNIGQKLYAIYSRMQ